MNNMSKTKHSWATVQKWKFLWLFCFQYKNLLHWINEKQATFVCKGNVSHTQFLHTVQYKLYSTFAIVYFLSLKKKGYKATWCIILGNWIELSSLSLFIYNIKSSVRAMIFSSLFQTHYHDDSSIVVGCTATKSPCFTQDNGWLGITWEFGCRPELMNVYVCH